ncbi:MAG: hypothetical protein ACT4O9_00740 [Blastocatellia bacterium]
MNVLKSIGAVLAGFIFIVVTHTVTDFILESLGLFPKPGEGKLTHLTAFIALVYRIAFSIAGCYVTARLAPSRPMMHAMIIGFIGIFLSLIGLIVSMQMDLGPIWYPIALAAVAVPCAWAGGKLAEARAN